MKKVSARKSGRKNKKTKPSPIIRLVLFALPVLVVGSIVVTARNRVSEVPVSGLENDAIQISTDNENLPHSSDDKRDSSQDESVKNGNKTKATTQNCTQKEIAHGTVYLHVDYLQKGQTDVKPGQNGMSRDCGGEDTVVISPIDRIVYVGTGLTDEEIAQQKQSEYDKRYMLWVQARNTAYQHCMNGMPADYPLRESFCTTQASQQAGQPPQSP